MMCYYLNVHLQGQRVNIRRQLLSARRGCLFCCGQYVNLLLPSSGWQFGLGRWSRTFLYNGHTTFAPVSLAGTHIKFIYHEDGGIRCLRNVRLSYSKCTVSTTQKNVISATESQIRLWIFRFRKGNLIREGLLPLWALFSV